MLWRATRRLAFPAAAASSAAAAVAPSAPSPRQQQQQRRRASPPLMRFRVRCDTIAAAASPTAPVAAASFASVTFAAGYGAAGGAALRPWAQSLRDAYLACLQCETSVQSVRRAAAALRAALSGNPASSRDASDPAAASSSSAAAGDVLVADCTVYEAALLLTMCHELGVPPTPALLTRCEQLVPQMVADAVHGGGGGGSPTLLLLAITCIEALAPHRLPGLLRRAEPFFTASAQSLRSAELFVVLCSYANCHVVAAAVASSGNTSAGADTHAASPSNWYAVLTPALATALLQRAVQLTNDFSVLELAQLTMAFAQYVADTSNRGNDASVPPQVALLGALRVAMRDEFGPRFVALQDLSTLRDAATMLWALALVEGAASVVSASSSAAAFASSPPPSDGTSDSRDSAGGGGVVAPREVFEACARRIFLMLRDADSELFTMTLAGLAAAPIRAPRLMADLRLLGASIDCSALAPEAALDAACAAAELGLDSASAAAGGGGDAPPSEGAPSAAGSATSSQALFARLTAQMLRGRAVLLRRDATRAKLLYLAALVQA